MLAKFYPIVPDSHWVERLVKLDVKLIQLRIKDQPQDIISEQIERALKTCRKHDCELVVNDHWQLALEAGANFIHLGQEDLQEADLEVIRGAGCRIGISTHSEKELTIALAAAPDYVALGPIWETTLKVMKWAPQGIERIKLWKSLISCPLVAIGGITLERAPLVFAAGANSIAMVSDILAHKDPEARIAQWLKVAPN